MKKLFLIVAMLMLSTAVMAKPQTLAWTWPTTNCDGDALTNAEFTSTELIYDVNPMPMPEDDSGPCAGENTSAPASATVVQITDFSINMITLNLMPGMTYYARMRLEANVPGNWSSWSGQLTFTVPYGKPNKTLWLN